MSKIMKMSLLEKQLNKFRPKWKERAKRRKSLWHLPKIIISFFLLVVAWFVLFKGMWEIHVFVYPEHYGRLNEFWGKGLDIKAFISSFLMVVPLFLPAMGIAFIVTNAIFWLIPPARVVFEKEAAGDRNLTFIGATSGMAKVFVKYLIPIGLGLSLLGTLTLSNLH